MTYKFWHLFLLQGLVASRCVAADGIAAPMHLSLLEAHNQALAHNQPLAAAQNKVDAATAAKRQTWAGHLPQISLSEQVVRSNDAVNAFGFKLKQERFTQADFALDALNKPGAVTNFQTSLNVHQPLFNGGQAIYQRRQAAAAMKATQAQLVRQQQETVRQTSQAYWDLVLAREALKTVRQGLTMAHAHAHMAQAHYEQQLVPLTDLLAAQVRVAELKNEEITAVYHIGNAEDRLSLFMGLDPTAFIPTDGLKPISVDLPLAELEAVARQQRPDLAAMQQQVEAVRQSVKVEQAAYLPHVNAFARVDLDADTPLARQGEGWTVGAVITWNLFSGFNTVGAVQQANAQQAQAKAQLSYLQQQIDRQVRQAHRALSAAQNQIHVAKEALDQTQERQRISKLQYKEGLITATDLLAAETAQTQTHLRLLQALHALNVGVAQLELAVGKKLQ